MATPILRPAVVADIDDVLAFWQTSAITTRRRDSVVNVTALLAAAPGSLMLAVDDGAIVGSLIAGWDGWRASLYRLAVRPDRRREGIAGLLLGWAEQHLRDLGAVRADAMVLNDNAAGQALWSAAGYVRETDCARWVRPI